MKRIYIKHNFKYWTMKKISRYSSKIWLILALLMALFTLWAYIYRQSNIRELISPISHIVVTPIYANEIPKEQTTWYRLYKKVRWLESNNGTKGLAVTCKNKGKINDIGYLPYKGFCFNNETDQEITFALWMEKHLYKEGMNEEQALNHYSNYSY